MSHVLKDQLFQVLELRKIVEFKLVVSMAMHPNDQRKTALLGTVDGPEQPIDINPFLARIVRNDMLSGLKEVDYSTCQKERDGLLVNCRSVVDDALLRIQCCLVGHSQRRITAQCNSKQYGRRTEFPLAKAEH
jgi:hypothetical protein